MALEDFLAEADRCSQCSYCKWIPFDQMKSWRYAKNCPSITYHNFNTYSARGRYWLTRSLLLGDSAITDKVREAIFTCMACGSCDVSCKVCRYNLEPLDMVRELKFKAVKDGHGLQAHRKLVDFLAKEHNTMMQPKADRGAWAKGLDVPKGLNADCEVLFFAGCKFSYDQDLQKSAVDAVSILKDAGVKIGILGEDEVCCGSRIFSMGYKDESIRFAKMNKNMWKKTNVKTIVTSCSDCYYAFKHLYPSLGSEVEVLHTTEYLHRLLQEGKLTFTKEVPITVTYHDPCHLGRQGEPYIPWDGVETKIRKQIIVYDPPRPRRNGAWGVYDQPRDILKAIPGVRLVEMERIREYSWCCGAGGGVREAYPEYSTRTASERIDEATSTGAEAIVSTCPWCERNFMDAVAASNDSMKIYDMIELVRQAL
jgi:Fe-S oxidoreductase